MSQRTGSEPTLRTTFRIVLLDSSDQRATLIASAQLVAIAALIAATSTQVSS